jgi:shikimate dehydrogenase
VQQVPAEYGVIGHPVAHSRSPFIHAMFARQTHQDLAYRRHDVAPQDLQGFVMDFWRRGGKGLNVTVPHKVAVCEMVRSMSERAQRAGAVNTLLMDADGIIGDNTDGAGLVRDLGSNLKVALAEAHILLVGAGGAARGVIAPLLDESPARIVVAGRAGARAAQLALQFAALGPVSGSGFEGLAATPFDVVINATSAGLVGEVPAIPPHVIGAHTFCYDMSYARGGTAFIAWARAQGCRHSAQGWGMLVEQAAESFELWRGVRPDTAPVLDALLAGA